MRVSPFCRKKAAPQSSVLLALAVADGGVSGGIPSGAAAIIQFYELGMGTDRPCFASIPSASARRLLIDYDGHKQGGGEDDNEILEGWKGGASRGIKRTHLEGGRERGKE